MHVFFNWNPTICQGRSAQFWVLSSGAGLLCGGVGGAEPLDHGDAVHAAAVHGALCDAQWREVRLRAGLRVCGAVRRPLLPDERACVGRASGVLQPENAGVDKKPDLRPTGRRGFGDGDE